MVLELDRARGKGTLDKTIRVPDLKREREKRGERGERTAGLKKRLQQ